jgi:copper chaperone CopZ
MKPKTIASALAIMLLLATSARAELRHVEIKTLGMDWEICAHAVRVAMQKVAGIHSVRISLNDGLTILDLESGNTVTLAKIRQVIKSNGFVSKEATVRARGSVNPPRSFIVSGTNEQVDLSADPRPVGESWTLSVPTAKR